MLWERAQEVFLEALEIPPAERAPFLNRACAGDSLLREEVESLLAHDIGENELASVFQCAAAALIEDGSLVGQRVGAYRITAELGHGGMGAVYLAVRADDEFRKKVAIKVVKRGMDTYAMLERFRYERQILANLDHPYIARLMDGGSTAEHQPFFVLEYVEGQPIDRFCRDSQLTIEEICRLFLRVCEAVAYAHRNLVVHRDLKPGNIIVTADGAPKLLDFGVAKLLSPETAHNATVTGLSQRPLTPEYASPEQVRGLAVTTAADVYSLGAVLYELLTGSRVHSISSNTTAEWERAVCETEVPRPSSHRRQLSGDLDNILLMALRKEPQRRYSSVEQFASDIQRYLGGLPVAACQDSLRYRTEKYVKRHRMGIAAAVLVAASLFVGAILALSEAHQARAARKIAEQERARAEDRSRQADAARLLSEREHAIAGQQRAIALQEASIARSEQGRAEQRLTQLVQLANKSLFDVHAAIERLPGATAARREIVKTTLDYLESLEKEAGSDDRVRLALGAAYLRVGDVQGAPNTPSLGDTAAAMKSYLRATEWVKPLFASRPRDPDVLSAWIDIQSARASLLITTGQSEAAVGIVRSLFPTAAALSRLSPGDSREANLHQIVIGALQYNHPAEAIGHARQAAEGFSKLVARDPSDLEALWALSAVHSLWASVLHPTEPAAALEHFRESSRVRENLIAQRPDNSAYQRSLMLSYGQIASILGDAFQIANMHDVEGARTYYLKAAAIARELARADPVNRIAKYDLASVELRLGALDPTPAGEAESLASLKRAAAMLEDLVKADPQTVRYQRSLALAYEYIGNRLRDAGNPAEALAEYRKSLASIEKVLSVDAKDIPSLSQALASEQAIANLLAATGDRAGAIDYARQSVARAEGCSNAVDSLVMRIHLARAYAAMALVHRQFGNWPEARATAARAALEWRNVIGNRKENIYAADLTRAEQLVAECDTHLH
jgi:eukaryotic-like serine/threonine-protein kinase